jgi:hypothetical protein
MNLFTRWFSAEKPATEKTLKIRKTYESYTAAGCLFTENELVLAGIQPNKTPRCISGLGGKKHFGETYIHTALREMVEELYGYDYFEHMAEFSEIIRKVINSIPIRNTVDNGNYISIVYTFKDLETIMGIVAKQRLSSPFYLTPPKTLQDLLLKRNWRFKEEVQPEVTTLVLLPTSQIMVDHNFTEDVRLAHLMPSESAN